MEGRRGEGRGRGGGWEEVMAWRNERTLLKVLFNTSFSLYLSSATSWFASSRCLSFDTN